MWAPTYVSAALASDCRPAVKQALERRGLQDVVTLVPLKVNEQNPDDLDFWSEDQGELHVDGSVSVPRSMKQGEGIGERPPGAPS